MRRVAITGIGVISPVGNNSAEFYSSLMEGRSGIACLRGDFPVALTGHIAAQVEFNSSEYFPKPLRNSLDRFSQFALAAAAQAISDAVLNPEQEDRTRIGVCIGSGMGGARTIEDGYTAIYKRGATSLRPQTVLMAMNCAGSSQIALTHALAGPNMTFSTACSSSALAIGEAYRLIKHGYADVMLAGGAEALLTCGVMKAWEGLRTLATADAEDPSSSCRPFSLDRSGLVLGEGAAIVVLEACDRALQRKASIYGEVIGFGSTNDTLHITRPSVEGEARAMKLAIDEAGIQPADIDYINAHGTATQAGDRVESAAIKHVFGKRAYRIPVSSTKSMHGHMMGATAAVEFIASTLAIKHQSVPPTANWRETDPECDLDYVVEGSRTGVNVRTVMSNSFAFGGSSAVLIARSFE